jgi:NAD(P)-dependent dehydrogenase (short-subunit alcohol dehydrogenase family)
MADDIAGKVCLITGATNGIGKATAAALAKRGAHLLLHGRNAEKGAAVVSALKRESGNEAIELVQADFASLADVRRLAETVRARAPRLHRLINNAGLFNMRRAVTKDGYEASFAVNHLAPFLLTNLLLDTLKASQPSRIIVVSSAGHRGPPLDFDDLQSERLYRGLRAYQCSKLANLLFTRMLAKRLSGMRVTINALHPGLVNTGIGGGVTGPGTLVMRAAFALMGKSPEEGARTVVYLATSPDVEEVSGGYFIDEKRAEASPEAQDDAAAARLWQVSEKLTGLSA